MVPLPGLAPLGDDGQSALLALDTTAIVTGDAVALDMAPAGVATRIGAFVIDAVLMVLGAVGLGIAASSVADALDTAAGGALTLGVTVLVFVVWPVTIETLTHGRSVGKMALGLRVVRDDAGPIRMRQAFIRAMVAIFETWTLSGGPAVICALINRKGKRIGDLMAGTYVVTERPPRRNRVTIEMPPALASWADGTDLGQIPDPLARATREVLSRRGSMSPAAAEHNLTELANAMMRYVSPPPPAGTPPAAFLAAVLAERRDRDYARLVRTKGTQQAREQELHGLPYGLG